MADDFLPQLKLTFMPDISPFTGVLGNRLAAYLLRRTTLGPSKAQILSFAALTPQQALANLLNVSPITNAPIDPATNATWVNVEANQGTDDTLLRDYVVGWMLDNFRTDNTIRSKMILFLHQNWMVDEQVFNSHDLFDYLKTIEFYAIGSYRSLAKKMTRQNAMLIFLNGQQSTGNNPNENYAREFLELFTIGRGPQIGVGNYTNYTEDDIKAAARVFSGYQYDLNNVNVDAETSVRHCKATTSRHSNAVKTFSSAFGNTQINQPPPATVTQASMAAELDAFVNMVFNQLETAKNISRKLYRFFVHRDISAAVETDIISPMAAALVASNYQLSSALNLLLQSKHFYDLDDANAADNKIGAMVKSPLELFYNTMRFFDISPFTFPGNTPTTIWTTFYRNGLRNGILVNAQMNFFFTTSVAGFPAYYLAPKYDRNWFDASTITQRYYFGRCFLEGRRLPFSNSSLGIRFDFLLWARNNISNAGNGNILVDELLNFLLPEIPDTARRDYFLRDILLGSLSLINWQNEWNNYISTGNSTVVKPRLELLFRAILYAQEYQLQ